MKKFKMEAPCFALCTTFCFKWKYELYVHTEELAGFIEYANCELFVKADWFSADDFGRQFCDSIISHSCSCLKWYAKCDSMIGIILIWPQ